MVELKGRFLGLRAKDMQERLAQLGLQGWELVSAQQSNPMSPMLLFLKKPL